MNNGKHFYKSEKKYHKTKVYATIFWLSLLGLVVPFSAQFILPFFFPSCNLQGVEIWNQYVSIILGVVATLMSIISLKLSFDNVDQSYQTELRTQQLLNDITSHLNEIKHNQDNYLTKTDIISLLKNGYIVENSAAIHSDWKNQTNVTKSESKDI